jgi:uncharacterized repeat protein (TIGR03803 family)
MKTKILLTMACGLLVLSATTAQLRAQSAPTLDILYSFTEFPTDNGPYAAFLVQDNTGYTFYGTTLSGGSNQRGSIFKMTPWGSPTTLVSFDGTNGGEPWANLVQGSDGNFYGTTLNGGSVNDGTVFKVTPAGVLTTLVSFNGTNGARPSSTLVQGSDGNFYGMTETGGGYGDGTAFAMTPAGALVGVVSFTDANRPSNVAQAGFVQGRDGSFYGTGAGGSYGDGAVFKMTPASAGMTLTTVASFDGTNGGVSQSALLQGSDGNFYGTAPFGGSSNMGSVFKMTPAGALTTLVTFSGANGAYPEGSLIQGSDGNFYGTTAGGGNNNDGTVFELTPAGVLTTLISFGETTGVQPQATLVQGRDGNLYGTTIWRGPSDEGTIFKVIFPAPPPQPE